MNRQQRRQKQKAIPKYRRGMTQEDRVKALMKNGITPDDLQKAFDDGWRKGWLAGGESLLKTCYGAFVLALRKHYGFGHVRCKRALVATDELVAAAVDHQELIDEAFQQIGLKLNFDDPFERVEEVEA